MSQKTEEFIAKISADMSDLRASIEKIKRDNAELAQSSQRASTTAGASFDRVVEKADKVANATAGILTAVYALEAKGSAKVLAFGTSIGSIAGIFGPTGKVVQGISITTSTIVALFLQAQERMRETRLFFEQEVRAMERSNDLGGLAKRQQGLFSGDRLAGTEGSDEEQQNRALRLTNRGQRAGGIQGVSKEIATLTSQLKQLEVSKASLRADNVVSADDEAAIRGFNQQIGALTTKLNEQSETLRMLKGAYGPTTEAVNRLTAAAVAKENELRKQKGDKEAGEDAKKLAAEWKAATDQARDFALGLSLSEDPLKAQHLQQQLIAGSLDEVIAKLHGVEKAAAVKVRDNLLTNIAVQVERLREQKFAEIGEQIEQMLAPLSGDAIKTINVALEKQIALMERLAKDADASGNDEAAEKARASIPILRAQAEALVDLEERKKKLAAATEVLDNFTRSADANFAGSIPTLQGRRDALKLLEEQERELTEQLTKAFPTLQARVETEKLLAEVRSKLAAQRGGEVEIVTRDVVDLAKDLGAGIEDAANSALALVQVLGKGDEEIGSMLAGVGSLGRGISQIADAAKSVGGFDKLFSAGKSTTAAVGGALGVVGGLTAIAQATDLFGVKARTQAKELRQDADAFNKTIADVLQVTRTVLGQGLHDIVQQANDLVQEAYASIAKALDGKIHGKRVLTSTDQLQSQIDELSALGNDRGIAVGVRESILQYRDALIELKNASEANAAQLREQQTLEIRQLNQDLDLRRLVSRGNAEASDEARVRLELEREVLRLRAQYGDAIEDYITQLQQQTEVEIAATRAITARSNALQQLDDDLAVFGGTAVEQLGHFLDGLTGIFPELADIAHGLDLSSQNGLSALTERLRELYRTLSADGVADSERPLVEAIKRILGAIDGAANTLPHQVDAFTAALDVFNARVEVFGLSAKDQLSALATVFTGRFSVLDDILSGADFAGGGLSAFKDKLTGAIADILADGVISADEQPLLDALKQWLGIVNTAIDDATQEADAAAAAAEAARTQRQQRSGARISLFDLTGSDAVREQLLGVSDAFADLFAQFDLNTVEGLDAAKTVLRSIFTELESMTDEQVLAKFGVTRDALMSALLDADSGFDALKASLGDVAAQLLEAARAADDFVSSLTDEFLRAQGRDQEADTTRALTKRNESLKRASELGLGDDVRAMIEGIYQKDLADIATKYAVVVTNAMQGAATSAASGSGSDPVSAAAKRTRNNNVVSDFAGLSAVEAQSLAGLLRAVVINTSREGAIVSALSRITPPPALSSYAFPMVPMGSGSSVHLVFGDIHISIGAIRADGMPIQQAAAELTREFMKGLKRSASDGVRFLGPAVNGRSA